jgi:hypothetical protein
MYAALAVSLPFFLSSCGSIYHDIGGPWPHVRSINDFISCHFFQPLAIRATKLHTFVIALTVGGSERVL